MRLSAYMIGRFRVAERDKRSLEYDRCSHDPREMAALQLGKLNVCWRAIAKNVPFYRNLAISGKAPREFSGWDEYLERMPVITRSTAKLNLAAMTDGSRKAEFFRLTGGSTSQPIGLPAWDSEITVLHPDIWLGRSWYGIEPYDPMFLLWGHSHLLGSGFNGAVNARLRRIKDHLLGYTRFSAYDISDEALRKAGEILAKSKSRYMIGYSYALDRFVRANVDRDFTKLHLKAVIGAAEAFPFPDTVKLLEKRLCPKIGMEYGSVETALVGHTHPDGGYRVFWQNYFVEATEKSPSGGYVVRVTSLYPRCFPLVRYQLGDELVTDSPGVGIASFSRVMGRCNDYISMPDGALLHSEVISHCVRSSSTITGYQFVKEGANLELRLTAATTITKTVLDDIRDKMRIIHPWLASADIRQVKELERTIAGKTRMIIQHD